MTKKIEAAIQKALIHYLNTTQFPFKIKVSSNNNEHARHHVDMGVDVGSPDLLLCSRVENITYLFYLELKKKKGRLQNSQKEWNKDFDENFASDNCKRAVAYGYNEAIDLINNWVLTIQKKIC